MRLTRFATLLCLLALASAAMPAAGYEFSVKYFTDFSGPETGFNFVAEARDYCTNGYDREMLIDLSFTPRPRTVAAIYKTEGVDEWDGETGYYWSDERGPIASFETMVFDNIYFWAMPETPVGDIVFASEGTSYGFNNILMYKLYLVAVPQGITYGGPTEWGWSPGQAFPLPVVLPYYSTDDPSSGYKFRAEITAIPETSSLLALLGGLAGMGGVARRRRR